MISTINNSTTESVSIQQNERQKLLDAAVDIGMQLCKEAIWHQSQCTWIGLRHDFRSSEQPELISSSIGPGMYGGSSGIAYYLLNLNQYINDPIIEKHIIGAINHAIHHTTKLPDAMKHSYWSGHMGVALTALEIGKSLSLDDLKNYALNALDEVFTSKLSNDTGLDILDGCAGAITAVLHHKWIIPESMHMMVDQYLVKLAEKLIGESSINEIGRYWLSGHDQKPLLGYAHGTSGYAHALIEVGEYLNNQQYIQAGSEAIKYENHYYDEENNNWPDLRQQPGSNAGLKFMNAWCHGAMGIGLSRLRCYELLGDESYLLDAQKCLKHACLGHPINYTSACQCHGFSGNVELLLAADEILDGAPYSEALNKVGNSALEYHASGNSWINGLNTDHQVPGLMDGLAGVGYFFLRFYDQKETSSLLLLKGENK
ncbi:MAG: hypothetical protein HKN68_10485 [Saprospiraceae bacterium]|nr:hypothetical protein [Saprospiraceae bacterium]